MKLDLEGKCVLVAAASQGIGRAVASAFAAEGARIHICGKDSERLEATAQICRTVGAAHASWTVCDLATEAGPRRFVEDGYRELGAIDVLVTNCGGPPVGNFAQIDETMFALGLDITLRSVERMSRIALQYVRQSRGNFVHLTSLTVRQPEAQLFLSNSLRLAVIGLSKSIADTEGPNGVRSNCILTGRIDTERLRSLARSQGSGVDAVFENWQLQTPLRRIGQPIDIANAAIFLASSCAGYITGTCLTVDGGLIRAPI